MNDIKKIIDTGLDNINLSEDIKMCVLNKIKSKRKKRVKFKPLVIALASICTVGFCTMHVNAIANGIFEIINDTKILLQPKNESCTYDGIKMSLLSTGKEGNIIVAYFSLEDTTDQHRITGDADVYDWNFLSSNDASGNCQMYDYDKENEVATFRVIMSNMDNNIPWLNKNTLKVTKMLIGLNTTTEIVEDFDLYSLAKENLNADTETQYWNGTSGFSGCYRYDDRNNNNNNNNCITLKKNRLSTSIGNYDWLESSNIGFLDGHLHIQLQGIGKMSEYNHFSIDVIDKNGNSLTNNGYDTSYISWNCYDGYYYENNIHERAYEYCFPTITDISQLEGAKLQGTFCEYDTVLEGDWNITFSIED